jgi:hypothetical protein
MTRLRQKMIEDMQLLSFAERTQDSYLRAVRHNPLALCGIKFFYESVTGYA